MSIKLRKRKRGNKTRFILDYYEKGIRKTVHLSYYLVSPESGKLTTLDKDFNKEQERLANLVYNKKLTEYQNQEYGINDLSRRKSSFLVYFRTLTRKRINSDGNYGNWDSALKHLDKYTNNRDVAFEQIDKRWLEGFKQYLLDYKSGSGKSLSPNTIHSYYNKVWAALNEAVRDEIIIKNPATQTERFKPGDPFREFLTKAEVNKLVHTECEMPSLKRAFIFSVLTGLRYSDIANLRWENVFHSEDNGTFHIRFQQQKTKQRELLPITDQALKLLGVKNEKIEDSPIFAGMKYSAWTNLKLSQWVMQAGITKKITFHCARHTHAVLQLEGGTDFYTLSKLLGHKEIRTTQIYAKVVDHKKLEAVNRIQLDL
ncbi:MAG: recombinase [Chitinophagaceae bacterium]|nr:recombinase [Chitinophagaceae bacterium]